MEELRDIRGLEEIHDISLYLFIALIVFGLLLLSGLIMMAWRYKQSHSKDLTRKEVLTRLEDIDFEDSKRAAYKITKYARYLANNDRSKALFSQLEEKLSRYKYIKNPPAIDAQTRDAYHLFLEVVDA